MSNLEFLSDFGTIKYSLYLPENPNKTIIQIAHGMIEDRENYAQLIEFLLSRGFSVAINDHRGHGESIGGRSGKYEIELGEMGEDGFSKAVEDMHTLHLKLKQDFKDYKFVLLGHSMGSLLSRRFLQLYPDALNALVLIGSPSPSSLSGFGVFLCNVLESFGLNKIGTKILDFATLVSFNSHFVKKEKTPFAWISRDQNIVMKFRSSPNNNFSFSVNTFRNLFRGLRDVFSPYPNPSNLSMPILFASGADDACGEFGSGVLRAYKHLVAQGYENVELRLYSGARHELFNELNREIFFEELDSWLKLV